MRIRNDSDPYLSIERTEHAAYKKFPESLLWIVTQMRVPGVFLLTANTHTWKKILCRPIDMRIAVCCLSDAIFHRNQYSADSPRRHPNTQYGCWYQS